MRRLMIGTGWKMNLTIHQSVAYIGELLPRIDGVDEIDIFILPSFTALDAVGRALAGTRVRFGAQNMHWEEHGAFTGEVSPLMVRECGCGYVEIGHWERRRLYAESDEAVGLKVRSAWDHGLTPIACFGEEVRNDRNLDRMLRAQIRGAFSRLTASEVARSVLAYEPAWAIGTGSEAADPSHAVNVHQAARAVVAEMFGPDAAGSIRILYGGSVTLDNAGGYLAFADIDGLFVGRAALDPAIFADLIKLGMEWSQKRRHNFHGTRGS